MNTTSATYTPNHTSLPTSVPYYSDNKPLPSYVLSNPPVVDEIANTLKERGGRYGKFTGHAKITQDFKSLMQATKNWGTLAPDQKEALDMIVHKIGRILNGDPNYADSWHDIAGYSKLVDDRLVSGTET